MPPRSSSACPTPWARHGGRTHGAETALRACIEQAATLPRASWLRAIPWWARMECRKAAGDIAGSVHSGRAMGLLARAGEHESMARLAQRSVAALLERC